MRHLTKACAPALILMLTSASGLHGQISTANVLVLLKDQPQSEILSRIEAAYAPRLRQAVHPGTQPALLDLRREFAREVQAAIGPQQTLLEAGLQALGATHVVRHTAINGLSATLPAGALPGAASIPGVGRMLPQRALDLFQQIDQAVTSTSETALPVKLSSLPVDDGLSDVLDRLIDQYQLTVVIEGALGSEANAINVSGATAANGRRKPDFAAGEGISNAISLTAQLGVRSPMARKALLINSADSTGGWTPDEGWGRVNAAAIAALAEPRAEHPLCTDQDTALIADPSDCHLGSLTTALYYETKSSSPVKVTLAWNRHMGADGSPFLNPVEIHVLDRATGQEIAAGASAGDNVQQVTASADAGLIVKIVASGPLQGGVAAEPFALASSTPLASVQDPCNFPTGFRVSPAGPFHFPASGGQQVLTISAPKGCDWGIGDAPPPPMNPFVEFSGQNFPGPGSVTLTIPPNPTSTARSEKLVILVHGFLGPGVGVTQDPGSSTRNAVITVVSPTSGAQYVAGKGSISVIFTYDAGQPAHNAPGVIELMNGSLVAKTISASVPLTPKGGPINWLVPADVAAGSYTVRIRSTDTTVASASSGPVTVTKNDATITIDSPKDGDTVQEGDPLTVTFSTTGLSGKQVKVSIPGCNPQTINVTGSSQSVSVTMQVGAKGAQPYGVLQGNVAKNLKITVETLPGAATPATASHNLNVIVPQITVDAPKEGDLWDRKSSHNVSWTVAPSGARVGQITVQIEGTKVTKPASASPAALDATDLKDLTPGQKYQVSVTGAKAAWTGTSGHFIITGLKITAPAAGAPVVNQGKLPISWVYYGDPASATFFACDDTLAGFPAAHLTQNIVKGGSSGTIDIATAYFGAFHIAGETKSDSDEGPGFTLAGIQIVSFSVGGLVTWDSAGAAALGTTVRSITATKGPGNGRAGASQGTPDIASGQAQLKVTGKIKEGDEIQILLVTKNGEKYSGTVKASK
ncbi:MAG TPA: hypothetical protein VGZ73_09320 [Bryobacteraceae bacterium]|nr:hypothetical protein [Bryobacteraceae bacterium]